MGGNNFTVLGNLKQTSHLACFRQGSGSVNLLIGFESLFLLASNFLVLSRKFELSESVEQVDLDAYESSSV